jgi:hypothetical protein
MAERAQFREGQVRCGVVWGRLGCRCASRYGLVLDEVRVLVHCRRLLGRRVHVHQTTQQVQLVYKWADGVSIVPLNTLVEVCTAHPSPSPDSGT